MIVGPCHCRAAGLSVVCVAALLCGGLARAGDVRSYTDSQGIVHLYNVPHRRHGAAARAAGALQLPMVLLEPVIAESAKQYNLPPELVKAVIAIESNYNPSAVSAKGAIGLMQLMPQTAREMYVDDPYDPVQNIQGGARYLRILINRFGDGDLNKVLAAYNAGPDAVDRCTANCVVGVPPIPETIDYVRRVVRAYQSFKAQASAASGNG
ncbi:MAG TPA: lytic transglycosylase domain-containing protein [Myxococcales bacterium]|nr:lytic transglycosylase domain-containing protein [Myxococcales bacterium]